MRGKEKIIHVLEFIQDQSLIGPSGQPIEFSHKDFADTSISKSELKKIIQKLTVDVKALETISIPGDSLVMDTSLYEPKSYVNDLYVVNPLMDLDNVIQRLNSSRPVFEVRVELDKQKAILTVNGEPIRLGKGLGDKSIQYWICFHTLKRPNKAILETDILNSYKEDYGILAGGRAVRDANIKLSEKIESKTGIADMFLYSRGKVTFDQKGKNASVKV